MILIFAEQTDVHALTVQDCLVRQLNEDAIILDVADFPTKWNIDFLVGMQDEYIINCDNATIPSSDIQGAWRRRIKRPTVHETIVDPEVRHFCYTEARSFLVGLIANVNNVINTERSEHLATSKCYQLKVAADVGLQVPETLISSNPTHIRSFYDKHGGDIIFKVLTTTRFQFSETRLLKQEYLELLNSAIFAPTIYQKAIYPKQHLRITIIDDELFSASIAVTKEHALLDCRLDANSVIQASEIPPDLASKLLKFMQALGVRYGAIDMIISRDDEYFFLEINPGGQFLLVEIQTDQPISLALAKAISGRDK